MRGPTSTLAAISFAILLLSALSSRGKEPRAAKSGDETTCPLEAAELGIDEPAPERLRQRAGETLRRGGHRGARQARETATLTKTKLRARPGRPESTAGRANLRGP